MINVRMGLNSGPMVVGNMGSAQRMDYTIMGDAVNLAARLEGVNKFYGSATLISQHTQRLVGDALEVREVDVVRVVGKKPLDDWAFRFWEAFRFRQSCALQEM